MTKLDCRVSSCLYNKERCCCKDNIEVSGQNARHSRETCCRSFRERDAGQALSAVDIPTKNTEVACGACDCTFNEDCRCTAKHIGIAGGAACECGETECATFRCKCE